MVIITPGLHQPQSYHVFIIPIPIRAIPPITAVTVDAISIASESFACDQQAPWRRSWGLSSVFFVFGNAGEIHGNPMFFWGKSREIPCYLGKAGKSHVFFWGWNAIPLIRKHPGSQQISD